jgi:heme-degrading monooxygenase HmoA
MRADLDDPVMAGFVERLEPLNALADSSPGFVWRLQDEEGDATAIRVFEDERILFNLSVWRSIQDLEAYTYGSSHVEAVRARGHWFERMAKPGLVLWWLAAGELPTVEDARWRFELLWNEGPTSDAFTFRNCFEAPA